METTISSEKGQTMVAAIAGLVALSIMIPAMVIYTQHESSWTGKQANNTAAFHLAEAGSEKAYLALTQSTSTFKNITNGQTLSGFAFDTVYTDVAGGTYSVSIASGPSSGEVTVISVGKSNSGGEVRAVQIIYSEASINSAVYANGISVSGGVTVQWGPMTSLGNITLSGSANVCYPLKSAVGSITTSGSAACHGSWTSTSSPCKGNCVGGYCEWSAYNCSPGVPPAPKFDLASYRNKAKADSCPTSKFPAGASPAGSCYWPTGVNPSFSNVVMTNTSSATIFVEGSLTVSNGFLQGSVLVMGNLSFSGGGKGAYTIPDWLTPDGIPPKAWQQYAYFDTAAAGEYYGDAGYQTVNNTFTFGVNGSPPMQSETKDSPSIRGFVYCGGTYGSSGGTAIHGILYSPVGLAGGSGGFTVYYDDNLAGNLLLSNQTPTRISWQNKVCKWTGAYPSC